MKPDDHAPFRPQPSDTRYDLRIKQRLAQAHARLGEAGTYEHALAALAELAMGKKLTGEPLLNVHARTRVQAAAAFFRVAGMVMPKTIQHAGQDGGPLQVTLADVLRASAQLASHHELPEQADENPWGEMPRIRAL
ncbi:MAG: hypothetical protein O2894_10910 [Planctomycetota bacterium]|nr:hypothetical protein [Planctomycetota bacterium]